MGCHGIALQSSSSKGWSGGASAPSPFRRSPPHAVLVKEAPVAMSCRQLLSSVSGTTMQAASDDIFQPRFIVISWIRVAASF
ncbi:hypothetical protein MUK42_34872 [Musa troglodytarum]|uniref:Uncharacterized protein n=1 Tax=Musa troglodytarum TaxID=320322 RepID=A0A9E7JAS3_9LILI|nr:hypothetical protein MUK42_34872 [Musa troglodytarum]